MRHPHHVVAIVAVILIAVLAGAVMPVHALRMAVVVILIGFGVYRIVSKSHPRFGGMQVRFRDLTIWSFLMACAHGAGLMLLPVLLGMSAMEAGPESHIAPFPSVKMQLLAVAIHTPWIPVVDRNDCVAGRYKAGRLRFAQGLAQSGFCMGAGAYSYRRTDAGFFLVLKSAFLFLLRLVDFYCGFWPEGGPGCCAGGGGAVNFASSTGTFCFTSST
jgi:hypothetical protein